MRFVREMSANVCMHTPSESGGCEYTRGDGRSCRSPMGSNGRCGLLDPDNVLALLVQLLRNLSALKISAIRHLDGFAWYADINNRQICVRKVRKYQEIW